MDTSLVSNSLNQVAFITFFRVLFASRVPSRFNFLRSVIFFAMWLFLSSFLRKNKDESPKKDEKESLSDLITSECLSCTWKYEAPSFANPPDVSLFSCECRPQVGRSGVKFSYKYFNHKVMLVSSTRQHIIFVHTWWLSSCVLKDE